MPEDLGPVDVDEVRRRVVDPVVNSLVHSDELEEISVTIAGDVFPTIDGNPPQGGYLRVAVKARGEWISSARSWWVGEDDDRLWDAEEFAADLYDGLRDELTESRLSWGEWRDGEYTVLR
jgi:hypothetical protein